MSNDMDHREQLLRQDGFFIGIATLSLLNGMDFSIYFEPGVVMIRPLLFSFGLSSPVLVLYFTSLFLSITSVILAGVPAALFERATGRKASDAVSLSIWMGTLAIMTLPTFLKMLGFS
jgi:hypothetical protein